MEPEKSSAPAAAKRCPCVRWAIPNMVGAVIAITATIAAGIPRRMKLRSARITGPPFAPALFRMSITNAAWNWKLRNESLLKND